MHVLKHLHIARRMRQVGVAQPVPQQPDRLGRQDSVVCAGGVVDDPQCALRYDVIDREGRRGVLIHVFVHE